MKTTKVIQVASLAIDFCTLEWMISCIVYVLDFALLWLFYGVLICIYICKTFMIIQFCANTFCMLNNLIIIYGRLVGCGLLLFVEVRLRSTVQLGLAPKRQQSCRKNNRVFREGNRGKLSYHDYRVEVASQP